jgi:predicted metal-dependent HD superfamily phosphohydrolase
MAGEGFVDAWKRLSAELGCEPTAAEVIGAEVIGAEVIGAEVIGAELLERHAEPQRHYHSVEHIEAVLRHLSALDAATPATELAAFFHDAIYDPTAPDNEERSALLAVEQLTVLGLDAALVAEVAAIIRATAGHLLPADASPAMAAFLDADLSILGADPAVYAAYAVAIRREYAHMSDEDFRNGRAQVLRHFAERDELYFTAAGQARWESAARENLRVELHHITGAS